MPAPRKHGLTDTRLYRIWRGMKGRCLDPANRDYPSYGGRGIGVCEEWRDASSFFAWANSNGYRDDLQLDRIENGRGYAPDNCQWVTARMNARNRRDTISLAAYGEVKLLAEWLEDQRCCAGSSTVRTRLNRGWTVERAISTPGRTA